MRVTVSGDKELIALLEKTKTTTAKAAIRKGSRAGSKVVLAQAREEVPQRTGQLRSSLKVRALPRSRRFIGTQVQMQVHYGSFVELGTKHQKAWHFLKHATQEVGPEALHIFEGLIREELNAIKHVGH